MGIAEYAAMSALSARPGLATSLGAFPIGGGGHLAEMPGLVHSHVSIFHPFKVFFMFVNTYVIMLNALTGWNRVCRPSSSKDQLSE